MIGRTPAYAGCVLIRDTGMERKIGDGHVKDIA